MDVAHQVCILYAVIHNYLEKVETAKVPQYEQGLYEFMDAGYYPILKNIRDTGSIADEAALDAAVKEYTDKFIAEKQ